MASPISQPLSQPSSRPTVQPSAQPTSLPSVGVSYQAGSIYTFAGQRNFFGDGGGATAAPIYNPTAVAVSSMGDIFVVDQLNFAVRKVCRSPLTSVTMIIVDKSLRTFAPFTAGDPRSTLLALLLPWRGPLVCRAAMVTAAPQLLPLLMSPLGWPWTHKATCTSPTRPSTSFDRSLSNPNNFPP